MKIIEQTQDRLTLKEECTETDWVSLIAATISIVFIIFIISRGLLTFEALRCDKNRSLCKIEKGYFFKKTESVGLSLNNIRFAFLEKARAAGEGRHYDYLVYLMTLSGKVFFMVNSNKATSIQMVNKINAYLTQTREPLLDYRFDERASAYTIIFLFGVIPLFFILKFLTYKTLLVIDKKAGL